MYFLKKKKTTLPKFVRVLILYDISVLAVQCSFQHYSIRRGVFILIKKKIAKYLSWLQFATYTKVGILIYCVYVYLKLFI